MTNRLVFGNNLEVAIFPGGAVDEMVHDHSLGGIVSRHSNA
jgi:hypothetical protein